MSRMNKVLSESDGDEDLISKVRKKSGKKRRKENPVYDRKGKNVASGIQKTKKRWTIVLFTAAGLIGVIYLPQFFMKEGGYDGPFASPDQEAVKLCNAAVRSHTEDDFDGDGLTNSAEENYETNLWDPDTDGDGAYDSYEVNVSKTDPNQYNRDVLIDIQTKYDEANGKNVGTPYKIGNVILWAADYDSKAHGSVVETMKGYRFSDFSGWAQFPSDKGKYAYKLENGKRSLLPYREKENAWQITPGITVELYDEKLEEIDEFRFLSHPFYIESSSVFDTLASILPDKGIVLTGDHKMRIDVEPDTSEGAQTDIVKPAYDSSDDYRFTKNTNSLNDLLAVRKSISDEKSCVAVSLYNSTFGEYLAIVYGYDRNGNLLLADMNTLEPVATLEITERAKKIVNENGEMLSMSYFSFFGLGFSSYRGDRICFFAASSGNGNDFGASTVAESGSSASETTKGAESTAPAASEAQNAFSSAAGNTAALSTPQSAEANAPQAENIQNPQAQSSALPASVEAPASQPAAQPETDAVSQPF